MATIAKIRRKKGVSYKAKSTRLGRVLETKIFRTKTAARDWAKNLEADYERALSLDVPASGRVATARHGAVVEAEGDMGGVAIVDQRLAGLD